MPRKTLFRSIWLPLLIAGASLLLALSALVAYAWRNFDRLQPLVDLHRAQTELEQLHTEIAALENSPDDAVIAAARRVLTDLAAVTVSPATRETLVTADNGLAALTSGSSTSALFAAVLTDLASAVDADERLTAATLERDALRELELATMTLLILPPLGIAMLFLFRKRILRPLDTITGLLEALSRQTFTRAPDEDLDPTITPLVHTYNRLIARLEELEQEHRVRREELEAQISAATRALLDQQRSLANAEKLAAIGEIAASIAHELRNPLAGIQMAVGNLSQELEDVDQIERLGLVDRELTRVAKLLDGLLKEAAHRPELPCRIDVTETIRSLLALVRYQLPERVEVEVVGEAPFACSLPEQRLRQAMLNLILNSAQALGDSPGKVTIRVAHDSEATYIEVHDTGAGFPDSMLQNGVRPFASHRPGGTGLGLAMVQRFARDLGGRVQLANVMPRGGCVRLVLPMA